MNDILQKNAIECLLELSDENFQRRVWAGFSETEMSSFTEAVCRLFDDTGLGDLLGEKTGVAFTPAIDVKLRELSILITTGPRLESMPLSSIIEHPKMCEIRRVAAKILGQMKQEGIG
jgi:hypothetical protein